MTLLWQKQAINNNCRLSGPQTLSSSPPQTWNTNINNIPLRIKKILLIWQSGTNDNVILESHVGGIMVLYTQYSPRRTCRHIMTRLLLTILRILILTPRACSLTSNKCGLVSPPGRAIDLGVVQEQSRMEMLKYQPGLAGGWGCSRGGRAGSAPGFGLDWGEVSGASQ